MRVISNSLMAALVVAALFLGNCFSCPQILAAMAAHTPAHGCCHHKSQQPAANTECQSQALQHFVQSGTTTAPAPALMAVLAVPPAVMIFEPAFQPAAAPAATPPDLISLHSSFRI
jgi:hypothetical protein